MNKGWVTFDFLDGTAIVKIIGSGLRLDTGRLRCNEKQKEKR